MTRGTCGTESLRPLRGFVCPFAPLHGFADSPVALCLHPFRVKNEEFIALLDAHGIEYDREVLVGLRASTHFVGSCVVRASPRVRGLTRGFMPCTLTGLKEFMTLLDAHGIEYDERYLWD